MSKMLRQTGIGPLGAVPWGAHICLFYDTADSLRDSLISFFRAGLESNEYVVWIVSDPFTLPDAKRALDESSPSLRQYLSRGQVEVTPVSEWFGGGADGAHVTALRNSKLRKALEMGFEGLRVTGNADRSRQDHWDDFMAVERGVDAAIAGQQVLPLCTYPLASSKAIDLLEVARAHQYAVARQNGGWKLVEAFEFGMNGARPLTKREREVLQWAARGKSAWEIGEILQIAKRTVDEHVQTAGRKLGAANRAQSIAIAVRGRLIDV